MSTLTMQRTTLITALRAVTLACDGEEARDYAPFVFADPADAGGVALAAGNGHWALRYTDNAAAGYAEHCCWCWHRTDCAALVAWLRLQSAELVQVLDGGGTVCTADNATAMPTHPRTHPPFGQLFETLPRRHPTSDPVGLRAIYVAALIKAFRVVGAHDRMTFSFGDPLDVVGAHASECPLEGLIMPMRLR